MLSRFTNFLTEDGEKEWRQRDDEFEVHDYSKQQVIDLWNKGWECCFNALESLTENDLMTIIYIRKEPLTVVDAINRQLAHYPYHIGQIIYIGRMIKNTDWKSLSIPKGQSLQYNTGRPAKRSRQKILSQPLVVLLIRLLKHILPFLFPLFDWQDLISIFTTL